MSTAPNPIQPFNTRTAPLRGTQSFVGVMAQVWRRPGLLALELLWRWAVGLPLLALAWLAGARALHNAQPDFAALTSLSAFHPDQAAAVVQHLLAVLLPPLGPVLTWLLPLALLAWTLASALGKTAQWRRLYPHPDPQIRPAFGSIAALAALRTLALFAFYVAWLVGLVTCARLALTGPAARGGEPNLVLYTALVVGCTLFLFMLWSLVVWLPDAAMLFVLARGSAQPPDPWLALRRAATSPALRSKLIETNLVMGIVKVCILVLAMVLSASPLPFATDATQGLLNFWWVFVALLFVTALDLFHLVRRAAYLSLFRALVPPSADTTPSPVRAS